MRLFLAIDLPSKVKTEIEEQIAPLKKEYPSFTWIPKENYHITIHFYGEVKNEKKLIERLKTQLFDKESFYLYSTHNKLFINEKIIIYLNFRKEKKLLKIEKAVGDKKGFIPHLTFARCRIPSKQQYFVLKKRVEKLTVDVSFPVKELILFATISNGQFPHYKKLAKIPLIAP